MPTNCGCPSCRIARLERASTQLPRKEKDIVVVNDPEPEPDNIWEITLTEEQSGSGSTIETPQQRGIPRRSKRRVLGWSPLDRMLIINVPYSAAFIAELKQRVPASSRKWDGANRQWLVAVAYAEVVVQLLIQHYGQFELDVENVVFPIAVLDVIHRALDMYGSEGTLLGFAPSSAPPIRKGRRVFVLPSEGTKET